MPGGLPSEAIRRSCEESKSCPLEVLSAISPWNPLSTLSFHQENSAIAEGLVLLKGRILESSSFGVLCFRWQPSGYPELLWEFFWKVENGAWHALLRLLKYATVAASETDTKIHRKRMTKRNFKKCLTQAKRFANIYKLSRDESTTNLENQRSINTQTLKILKNFQRPAMVKRSRDRANLFAVKQRTEQS